MKLDTSRIKLYSLGLSGVTAALSILILLSLVLFQQPKPVWAQMTTTPVAGQAPQTPDVQLDSLVAPIALYPDPLLSQVLVASTYPLEIMQLQQFLNNNPYLKDKALGDGVELKPWDASVKALAIFPEAVKRLSGDLNWTTDLGNAFLAQPADVLNAVQRMRARAIEKGTLQTCAEQTVETEKLDGGNQFVTIEPTDEETVYVPFYDPTMAYGALVYPYPAIYYPPPGYYAPGAALAFAVGVALGKRWNGGWGYDVRWGSGDIDLNINNKFVKNSARTINQPGNSAGAIKWEHNPVHRGGTPYANRELANKYASMVRNVGGGNRLDGTARPGNTAGASRLPGASNPISAPARQPPRESAGAAGDRIGNHAASSFGNPGTFNGGGRDLTNASINRGVSTMGGGFQGGGGGFRGGGGGRRR